MNEPSSRPSSFAGGGSEESIAEYLQRRERELIQRAAAVRGMLTPIEQQLAEVRKAMQALGVASENALSSALSSLVVGDPNRTPSILEMLAGVDQTPSIPVADAVSALAAATPTIKQMILSALHDHFHHGASPTGLSNYMKAVYKRDIDRNSISPQLARLREDGMVDQLSDGKWRLSNQGKSAMSYGTTLREDIQNAAEQVERKASTPRQQRWYGDGYETNEK
jgi:DNA-binding transcriptional ArsR family regulator